MRPTEQNRIERLRLWSAIRPRRLTIHIARNCWYNDAVH